jgi:hypothetical protein
MLYLEPTEKPIVVIQVQGPSSPFPLSSTAALMLVIWCRDQNVTRGSDVPGYRIVSVRPCSDISEDQGIVVVDYESGWREWHLRR